MSTRHLISIHELTTGEVTGLFRLAERVKAEPEAYHDALHRRTLAMVFQKSSTRTRVSFETGMAQLGGHALFLSGRDLQLGRGETVHDTAQVLSRYVDGVMARTFAHQDVLDLARFGTVPVINGLTDELHPCQGLTDYFTLSEVFGGVEGLRGRRIAYLGDGNNMAHSLMHGAARLGMEIVLACPEGYDPREEYVSQAREDAAATGARVEVVRDPEEAARGAICVYTDVWASRGQEEEGERRRRDLAGDQVGREVMAAADPEAVFLHCLPCHRGEEVTAEVADGPQSRIFDQAENRLHVQKAILLWLMGGAGLS